jgi:hypothetical protein
MLGKHNIVSFKQINLLSYHGGEAYFWNMWQQSTKQ